MVCGDSTIIAKIAMIVMIVSFILATIAIFTPYWQQEDAGGGNQLFTGLVVACDNNLGYCFNLQTILERYSNQGKNGYQLYYIRQADNHLAPFRPRVIDGLLVLWACAFQAKLITD